MSKQPKRGGATYPDGQLISPGRVPVKVPFSEFRFVKIELTEAEKQAYKGYLDSGDLDNVPISAWVSAGYKLSVSRDFTGNCDVASLAGQYKGMDNAGCIITARGRDSETALRVLFYKVHYLVGEALWLQTESERGGGYSTDIG